MCFYAPYASDWTAFSPSALQGAGVGHWLTQPYIF